MGSLKKKAVSGLFWNFVEQGFLVFFRMLVNVFIARQLFPSDYGLIAIIMVFLHISDVLVNGGLKDAVIRKPDLNSYDQATVFIFNLVVAFALYILFFLTAPMIEKFYQVNGFVLVARVLGLVIIINAASMIQNALLTRNTNFKFLAKVNILATFSGGALGLSAALIGFGVWSLVIQSLTKALFTTVFFWLKTTWIPQWNFSRKAFTENFNFGYKLMVAGLINSVFSNLYQLVIGRVYSAESLGNYSQGRRLGEMTSQILYVLFKKTSYPILSSIQNEKERFNKIYLKLIRVLAFTSFPVAFLMLLTGKSLIILVLTEKWINAVPFFYILCFSGMFFPITGISAYAILAKGRSDLVLKYEVIYKILMVIMVAITFSFDIVIMVAGQGFLILLQFFVNYRVAGKVIGLDLISQLKATSGAFALSLLTFGITYILTFYIILMLPQLIIQAIIFIAAYLLLAYLFKMQELAAIKELVVENVRKFRQ